jgi:hypothetical protein
MLSFSPQYAPLRSFVAPAIGRAQLWRTLAGLGIALATYTLALQVVAHLVIAGLGPFLGRIALGMIAAGATPLALTALLFTFLGLTGGLALGLGLMMNRGLHTLIGPGRMALRCFLWVALPICGLWLLMMPLAVMAPNVDPHLSFWEQARWLPLALPGLLIQTGTEELIFRGYLQQQLAARWSSSWIWMALPSALFGALHWAPGENGALAPLIALWAFAFGLAAADLTARTGNLGAAIGLHFATNAQTLFLVGLNGNLHGLALFSVMLPQDQPLAELPYLAIDSLGLLVSWLAARVILRV